MFNKLVEISENHYEAGLTAWQWVHVSRRKNAAKTQKATPLQPWETAAPLLQFGMHRLGKQDFNRLFGTEQSFPKDLAGELV